MVNWKQKLTSRKLWAAIVAVLVTILTAVFKEEIPVETANLIGKGVVALCCYIFGESAVDAARVLWTKAINEPTVIDEKDSTDEK